jgi:predicted chitinase
MSDAEFVVSAMPVAAITCSGTDIPEGSFPVGLKFSWHGGRHLHAPALSALTLPVRAIADGEIVFARKPAMPVADAAHPQNYNPYGSGPAWTDNGMIIIRHNTDVGDGGNAQNVEFYSIIMHLSELSGHALKVAQGTASPAQRKVFRKEKLGMAGRIYNAADHIHLEVVCDDLNFQKLVGRTTGNVDLSVDGRIDAIYGEIFFHLPAGTKFYGERPAANSSNPAIIPVFTSELACIAGLRHGDGDGAPEHRGDDYPTTYLLDGTIVGNVLESHRAEYEMYSRSIEISDAYPVSCRPSSSAVYELLRFGRIINSDHEHLVPVDCPHWRRVSYPGGEGWVNLNGTGVAKYSDADFPHWKGWTLIDDDMNGDSRADSALLFALIGGSTNSAHRPDRENLERRLSLEEVRSVLGKSICKLPSEWNRDTIDDRWGWLQSSTEHQLTDDSWNDFRAHAVALGIPAANLPDRLRCAHWHFDPLEFITHFKKCAWLSASEFRQMVPKHVLRNHGSTHLWEAVSTNLTEPASIAVTQRVALNKMARKYGIVSPWRQASFYGNSIQETCWLSTLCEGNGDALWYAPWYGRGFLQLTNPDNFIKYWRYRGRLVPDSLCSDLRQAYDEIAHLPGSQRNNSTLRDQLFPALNQKMCGWRDEVRGVSMAGSTDSDYAPADSAGFYWAKCHMASYADSYHVLERVSVPTNQGGKVYYRSPSFWRSSAAVNLPSAINMLYSGALNGFPARCVAYGYVIAVLSETFFPDCNGEFKLEFPECYLPRR